MDKGQLSIYLNAMNDCWQFMKYFLTAGDGSSKDFWDVVIVKAEAIDKKYNNPFVRQVLIAATDEIDRTRNK